MQVEGLYTEMDNDSKPSKYDNRLGQGQLMAERRGCVTLTMFIQTGKNNNVTFLLVYGEHLSNRSFINYFYKKQGHHSIFLVPVLSY